MRQYKLSKPAISKQVCAIVCYPMIRYNEIYLVDYSETHRGDDKPPQVFVDLDSLVPLTYTRVPSTVKYYGDNHTVYMVHSSSMYTSCRRISEYLAGKNYRYFHIYERSSTKALFKSLRKNHVDVESLCEQVTKALVLENPMGQEQHFRLATDGTRRIYMMFKAEMPHKQLTYLMQEQIKKLGDLHAVEQYKFGEIEQIWPETTAPYDAHKLYKHYKHLYTSAYLPFRYMKQSLWPKHHVCTESVQSVNRKFLGGLDLHERSVWQLNNGKWVASHRVYGAQKLIEEQLDSAYEACVVADAATRI